MRWTNWAALVVGAILALGWSASGAAAQEPDGAALYRQNCRSCHGGTGVPPARMVTVYPTLKTLADTAFLRGRSVDSIAAVIKRGAGRDMKALGDRLSAEEIRAIATFVKALGTK